MESTQVEVQTRVMIRRDMPGVMNVERACYENPWTESEYLTVLQDGSVVAVVAEHQEIAVGVLLYARFRTHVKLINICVLPEFRRNKIGTRLVNLMKNDLNQFRRNKIVAFVRDSNLGTHKFLAKLKFEAFGVEREFYEDTDDDAYEFRYTIPGCGED